MAPAADREGYWGPPTSTLEWCEENYAVSYYIAEFWNTVSNLIFILPPIYGAIQTYKDGLEKRYLAAYLCLTAVGLGSWCFHMTLKYEMQGHWKSCPVVLNLYLWHVVETVSFHRAYHCHHARVFGAFLGMKKVVCKATSPFPPKLGCHLPILGGEPALNFYLFHIISLICMASISNPLSHADAELLDELPMIYSCCVFVYCLYECFKYKNTVNYALLFLLITYSVVVSIVYLDLKEPVFHQIMYGTLVSIIVLRSVYIVLWVYPWLRGLGYTSLTVFLMGFFLWNVDNIFCDKLRALREKMPPVVGAVTQFHAWWHILTGLGSYLHILLR
ncbi:hypothetical protein IHE44_0005629 [Lamprotornis superbus]|uniref:Alkaline ceramidase n=1 Tax=Lamprotornis superbus TaxID=245042 RepID=A0A835NKM4_9PASS|nr:hypothetical protein IHE44_0005629 [Lamprotornis superbus]